MFYNFYDVMFLDKKEKRGFGDRLDKFYKGIKDGDLGFVVLFLFLFI